MDPQSRNGIISNKRCSGKNNMNNSIAVDPATKKTKDIVTTESETL